MLSILLHSSKTMRSPQSSIQPAHPPALLAEANELASYLKKLSPAQLQTAMKLSAAMAVKTHELVDSWSDTPEYTLPAIDAFIGDIYSGLQVQTFNEADRAYANEHLFILSGLYGVLRALDDVQPYRLEMGYRLPDEPYRNLYKFWGDRIAHQLPEGSDIINLSAVEYTKAVLPHLPEATVVSPKFLTRDPKSGEPKFVTVHAKIARGAFARWLIAERIDSLDQLKDFVDLGYRFELSLSTTEVPVFVCNEFEGLGLSVRLT